MTERHDDPALMTGSHALDALSDDERALLEDALRTSPELQAENDSLRETALQLAYAVAPIEPPASLKASLLAQIATTPRPHPSPTRRSTRPRSPRPPPSRRPVPSPPGTSPRSPTAPPPVAGRRPKLAAAGSSVRRSR